MGFFNKYPYTDFHELNLDWIIEKIKDVENALKDYQTYNKITWEGIFDVNRSYKQWSIVQSVDGTGYMSIIPVPANTSLQNDTYWQKVANYKELYDEFNLRLSVIESALPVYTESDENVTFGGKIGDKTISTDDVHIYDTSDETMSITQQKG